MLWLQRIEHISAALARFSGGVAILATLLLLLNVFSNVVRRYAFDAVSIGLQEMEWHLFAVAFLFGVPYAMHENAHVRVDILYEKWPDRRKAWVNLCGTLCLVWPFCVLLMIYGVEFSAGAYEMGEGSGDPGGLPHRWLIKSAIPISFLFMLLVSSTYITQALRVLCYGYSYDKARGAHLS